MAHWILISLVALSLAVVGCDEDHCMSGDRTRCDGEVIQECDGYTWVDVEDCSESELGPFCDQLDGGDAYCTDGTF
jgi:hypothetical protein